MCTTCNQSIPNKDCPACAPELEPEEIGFKCDNCCKVAPSLTLVEGWKMCDDCIASHENELNYLINQIF